MAKSVAKLDKYFSDVKVPDNINKDDIQSIKDWASKQPHLPQLTDRQISIFLHSCFCALELTKTTIDTYYTIRTHAPDLFSGRTPKEVAETMKTVYCVTLENVCPDGCRIVLLGLYNPDPDKFNLCGYLRALFSTLDILYNENSFDEGLRLVYDMTGASFGHLAKFTPTVLKKAFMYLQKPFSTNSWSLIPVPQINNIYGTAILSILANQNRKPIIHRSSTYLFISISPELSLQKHRLLLAGMIDFDSEKFHVAKIMRAFFSLFDIEGNIDSYAEGWRVIINAKGFSFGHFTKLTTNLSIIHKGICYVQDALPLRLKGIHVFNAIPLINQFLAIIRPIMKKELYEMIHIHSTSDTESLYKFIPKTSLPSNFGGNAPTIDELITTSNEKMKKYKDWFADDDKIGRVDETKRAGKAKNSGDIFGIEGSFKKLDLD